MSSSSASTLDPRVLAATLEHIRAIGDDEEPFYTVDLRSVAAKYQLLTSLLPRVQPFYTMKCNPDVRVFKLLTGLGCGVDCASKPELAFALAHGVAPGHIIYANTIKQKSHLQFARTHKVSLMTFDNVDELVKVATIFPAAELVLRIQVDDSKSRHQLGAKFGAPLTAIPELLETAKRLQLNVMGVSFHVGVGVLDASAFTDAIERSRRVFELAETLGFHFTLLNIGGGFAGDDLGPVTVQDAALAVNTAIATHFPASAGVRVISEPGRYFVSACATLNVNVTGRKPDVELTAESPDAMTTTRFMYFVNDGAHGSFSAPHLFKLYDPIPTVVQGEPVASAAAFTTQLASVWGPTCDGKDVITKRTHLPLLDVGDWLTFPHMGAYGFATGGTFNGFQLPGTIYVEADDEQ